jgi:hypothetical protein
MKQFHLALAAGIVCALGAGDAFATIRSYSATLESSWPSAPDTPLEGVASLALDDVTNELSWAVEWGGSTARRARVNLLGPLCAEDADCPSIVAPAFVLDLAEAISVADVRGGALSGRFRLTQEQAEELAAAPDGWRLEVQLWNKRGVRLEGEIELNELPSGIWF